MNGSPLQRLHLLTLKIVRTQDGVRATFGGRGMTPDDIAAMTRALAAEMLSASLVAPASAGEQGPNNRPDPPEDSDGLVKWK